MDIKDIWDSSYTLPRNHGIEPNPEDQRKFFAEEARELIEASVKLEVYVDMDDSRLSREVVLTEEMCKEAFDAIYTALGVLQSHGIEFEEFMIYAGEKLALNNAKTPENGYGKVNGKVKKI